jgi:formate dehydrogenase maturation protein FdhE
MTSDIWAIRIKRAEALTAAGGPSTDLLAFYSRLLHAQRAVDEALRSVAGWLPSGSLEQDLPVVRRAAITLVRTVAEIAPAALAAEGRRLLALGDGGADEMLLHYWRAPSDVQFFAKASLQPYGRWLAALNRAPADRPRSATDNRCPSCGGAPQLAIIHEPAARADGGGRSLACSLCDTVWSFRRIRCPSCGEEDEKKLGYFQAPEYDHVRVDACETCRRYLKAIDVSRLGTAVPIVDEVAAAPLDAWARERGYTKIELNLVGL